MAGAQIKRFLVLHKELDPDDGELTRTLKVRRSTVSERYAPLIEALYDGSAARALMLRNRIDEAIDHFREAVRLDPDYGMARENLRDALAQQKRRR